jgi:WhiB family redox-sensing transcriptional regulator
MSADRSPAWMESAACQYVDSDLFFPERGGSGKDAKRICRQCPVRRECLAYALSALDRLDGIWGGLTESERREPRRQLRRAA